MTALVDSITELMDFGLDYHVVQHHSMKLFNMFYEEFVMPRENWGQVPKNELWMNLDGHVSSLVSLIFCPCCHSCLLLSGTVLK